MKAYEPQNFLPDKYKKSNQQGNNTAELDIDTWSLYEHSWKVILA